MFRFWLACMVLAACVLMSSPATADIVYLKNGSKFTGVVLEQNITGVTLRTEMGTMGFYPAQIDRVEFSKAAVTVTRIASWETCLKSFSSKAWGGTVEQVPATVIDKGVLRHVPYMSHRSGDYEVNVYGDPDKPACVEIGVYNKLLDSDTAKANCKEFIKSILGDAADKAIVDKLKMTEDLVDREKMTLEVTPSTGEDAYGGWWISIYITEELDKVRATDAELNVITQSRTMGAAVATMPSTQNDDWSLADLSKARTIKPTPVATPRVTTPRSNPVPSPVVVAPSSSTGRVYVRGYYRKDGTYVRPHTRSR